MKPYKKIGLHGLITLIMVFATLLSTYPYVLGRFFLMPNLTIMIIAEIVVFAVVAASIRRPEHLPLSFSWVCLAQFVIFLFLFAYHNDTFYLLRFALFTFISYFTLYVLQNSVGVLKFAQINNIWITIQAVLGVIGYILITKGFLEPLIVHHSEISDNVNYFYGITTTNTIIAGIPRIAGYFDEPGALAQWGVYALVLNRISKYYSRKIELLLSICLVVTFSLAFFVQITIYYIVFYFNRFKKITIVIIVFIGTFLIAQSYIQKDSVLYSYTFNRMESNYGKIETNRDQLTQNAKEMFLENPFWGKGYTNSVENSTGFYDNPYETLATCGILGTFALYLPLLVILFNYRRNGSWQAVVVLTAGYLQRPFHIQYIHYLMIYLLFIICCYNKTYANSQFYGKLNKIRNKWNHYSQL